jgi:hypothetical protein
MMSDFEKLIFCETYIKELKRLAGELPPHSKADGWVVHNRQSCPVKKKAHPIAVYFMEVSPAP